MSSTYVVPIRTVCAMYNLNPNTLRTWERRYGIVKPQRSDGGHRGYNERDLANIESMIRMLNAGVPASEAARRLLSKTDDAPVAATARAREFRARFREAVQALDQAAAGQIVEHAHRELGYGDTVENVLFPELVYWGEQWEATGKAIAQEHLASYAVRSYMGQVLSESLKTAQGQVAVMACAPAEPHDLPITHVSNLVAQSGLARPVLLVGGLPISEIIDTAERTGAGSIVLSATITPRPEVVRQWIAELGARGWESRTILVGSGFSRSRVFSETQVRSAPGSYSQILHVLLRVFTPPKPGDKQVRTIDSASSAPVA